MALIELLLTLAVLAFLVWLVQHLFTNDLKLRRKAIADKWETISDILRNSGEEMDELSGILKDFGVQDKRLLELVSTCNRNFTNPGSEGMLSSAEVLGKAIQEIGSLSEDYPSLRANDRFSIISKDLVSQEKKLLRDASEYNDIVEEYNQVLSKAPFTQVAKLKGFGPAHYYSLKDEEENQ